ncbi:MAG: hypothetical protein L0241_31505, partial [Planctomycetia bacterium]|nr:hypothetical protein [Planctomycetia bacterium]
AACWQFGVHYPSLWAACAPGAGFAETPEFLDVFQKEKVEPTWYEKKLWHMYNATDYASNLFNVPTIAYSGELDKQKQAADVMEREMKKLGLKLSHIIGPKTEHSYEKGAKEEINKKLDALVARDDLSGLFKREIRFTTFTLRYNESPWVRVEALGRHWERATVNAELLGNTAPVIKTENVTAIRLTPFDTIGALTITLDGQKFTYRMEEKIIEPGFRKVDGKWVEEKAAPAGMGLVKKHGLQGPIDDAFMDSFIMVKPSGRPMRSKTADWAEKEMKHAISHWRSQFRGDAPVKDDIDIRDEDIKNNNLILWGDPMSNSVLTKIADKLPVKWTDKGVTVGKDTYELGKHVPVLIYPNPLNPKKYVVINSGFTFREYDYLNNARQVPKLPDYAMID